MIKTQRLLLYLLPGAYLVIFVAALRTYIVWQSVNLVLGLISLLFTARLDSQKKGNKRFAVAALVAIALAFLLPVKTMLFVSLLFGALFFTESYFGSINMLPVFTCFLISPFAQYLVSIFSFSIRIMLSAAAGRLLHFFGDAVSVSGNIIKANGKEFAVDPACMGLNMMVTSVLLGLVLIGIFQKRVNRTIGFWQVTCVLAAISVLNIASNLFRIIVLVKFSIMPENSMHEIAGLICLFIYVCMPSVLLVQWVVGKFAKVAAGRNSFRVAPAFQPALHLLILLSVTLLSFTVDKKEQAVLSVPANLPALKGFAIQSAGDNIIKLQSPNALIYIKPITNFYDGEHNPSICWKGSGYEMTRISDGKSGKQTKINTAILQKQKAKLYTAWWYDNGEEQTTSQAEWRWKMFKGSKPFSVVNITAATEEELEKQVSHFLTAKINQQILLPKQS